MMREGLPEVALELLVTTVLLFDFRRSLAAAAFLLEGAISPGK
jgi:hypothetical protein